MNGGRLRVSGGEFRGRRISSALEGVRPTAARVREAFFSILGEELRGSKFLDLFSGSGIISFEAASRGAASVTAVEQSLPSSDLIRKTLESLDAAVTVRTDDVFRFLDQSDEHFDIVYSDPPWKFDRWSELLGSLGSSTTTERSSTIALETPTRLDIEAHMDDNTTLRHLDTRSWGETSISFFNRTETE